MYSVLYTKDFSVHYTGQLYAIKINQNTSIAGKTPPKKARAGHQGRATATADFNYYHGAPGDDQPDYAD